MHSIITLRIEGGLVPGFLIGEEVAVSFESPVALRHNVAEQVARVVGIHNYHKDGLEVKFGEARQ